MPHLIIAAITGPTGAGKSTISQTIARLLPNAVNIDIDHVKHFIVSDFRYEDGDDGTDQWRLLGKNLGMLAANYHNEGYNVIINGYIRQVAWQEMANYIQLTHKFLLMPSVMTVQERDAGRDIEARMGSQAVESHYAFFSSDYYAHFKTINSTNQTSDETASEVINLL